MLDIQSYPNNTQDAIYLQSKNTGDAIYMHTKNTRNGIYIKKILGFFYVVEHLTASLGHSINFKCIFMSQTSYWSRLNVVENVVFVK